MLYEVLYGVLYGIPPVVRERHFPDAYTWKPRGQRLVGTRVISLLLHKPVVLLKELHTESQLQPFVSPFNEPFTSHETLALLWNRVSTPPTH
jgi:hypothetical protein